MTSDAVVRHARARGVRRRWTLLADVLSVVGLITVLYVGHIAAADQFAFDAHAYWAADGYGLAAHTKDAFLYSPPVLMVMQALGEIPWPLFLEVYTALVGVGIWILAGPFTLLVIWAPQVASEITLANIHVGLALVAVYGLRWPGLWAFPLLTKVTPGIGLLWFVTRREWRSLAIALGVTAAIAVPTVIAAPDLWADWIATLVASSGEGSTLPPRLACAAVLTVVGARRDWPWVLPIACMLALPILWSVHSFSMLLGLLPFVRSDLDRRAGGRNSIRPQTVPPRAD